METVLLSESAFKLLHWKNAYKILTCGNMLCKDCEEFVKKQIEMIERNIREELGEEYNCRHSRIGKEEFNYEKRKG